MNKWKTVGIVVIGLLAWAALSVWNSGNGWAGSWPFFGTQTVKIAQSVDAGNIKNVVVDMGSEDVDLIRGGSDKIEIRLEGKASHANKLALNADVNGDTLKLSLDKPNGGFQFSYHNVSMTVELPEKQWDEIKVNLSSGDVSLADIGGKSVEVATSSGKIELADSRATTIKLTASSGDVRASGFKADTLSFHASSGNVRLEDGEAALKGETASGNIRVEFDELRHNADLTAGSGNVTLSLDRQPQSLAVDYRGGSGNGKIKQDGFAYQEQDEDNHRIKGAFGSGETTLKVVTGSGDFTLD